VKRLKKMAAAVVALMIILMIVYCLGPGPEIDLTIRAMQLPDDLDKHLSDKEAQLGDVTPGAEKTIVWADPVKKAKTPLSLVYFHGFSATRQETSPLCDLVAEELGANLFYTRLTGHGRSGEALGQAKINHWLNDAYEALAIGRRLGHKVVLVGVSTGATLATWLAAQADARDVQALVMISPNYGLRDPRASLLSGPWGLPLLKLFTGSYREFEARNEEHKKYWTTRYKVDAIVTMMVLVDLAWQCPQEQIKAPTLVIYSPQDVVINTDLIEAMIKKFRSKAVSLIPFTASEDAAQHVLAGRIISPLATRPLSELVIDFLKKHTE
jgi:pimeloyl-ACP methyl ester carboxylesterase